MKKLALISLVALMAGCDASNTTTRYAFMCDTPLVQGFCRGKAFLLNRMKVRVFPETQQAVQWYPGIAVDRLRDCAVVDVENWECHFPNRSGAIRMVDGRYAREPEDPREYEVNWLVWWKAQIFGLRDK